MKNNLWKIIPTVTVELAAAAIAVSFPPEWLGSYRAEICILAFAVLIVATIIRLSRDEQPEKPPAFIDAGGPVTNSTIARNRGVGQTILRSRGGIKNTDISDNRR